MGSFWGHIDEGIFFIILAVWWMLNCYCEYIFTVSNGGKFVPNFSFPLPGKRRIPLEIYLKIAFPVIGFLAEVIDGGTAFLDTDGNFRKLVYMQHMTIYGIFILHSITDLLVYYGVPLIRGTHYLTAAIAFFWYGMAFYFHAHMHGKAPLELIVHVLPIPVMLATAVTVLLEMSWKRGVTTILVRTYFVLTLGTWFSHVAFILYDHTKFPGSEPSSYDRNDHRNVAFAVAAFGMHLCFNLIFMVICYVITYFIIRTKYGIRITTNYFPTEDMKPTKRTQSKEMIPFERVPLVNSDDSCEAFLLKDCDF